MACDCQDQCNYSLVGDLTTTVVAGDGSAGNPYVVSVIGGDAPAGAIIPFAGDTAPLGFLLADGSTFNTGDYPDLAAILNGNYDTGGEPAGTMRLPDLRGRAPVGFSTPDTIALGDSDGAAAGSRPRQHDHAISGGTDPGGAHSHTVSGNTNGAGGHQHTVSGSAADTGSLNTGFMAGLTVGEINCIEAAATLQPGCSFPPFGVTGVQVSAPTAGHNHAVTGVTNVVANHAHTVSGTTNNTGSHSHTISGGSDANASPWLAVNFIIKT